MELLIVFTFRFIIILPLSILVHQFLNEYAPDMPAWAKLLIEVVALILYLLILSPVLLV